MSTARGEAHLTSCHGHQPQPLLLSLGPCAHQAAPALSLRQVFSITSSSGAYGRGSLSILLGYHLQGGWYRTQACPDGLLTDVWILGSDSCIQAVFWLR